MTVSAGALVCAGPTSAPAPSLLRSLALVASLSLASLFGGASVAHGQGPASDAPDVGPADDAGPAASAGPDEEAPDAGTSGPATVHVGIYPLRIGDLDLRTGTARLTYYQWQRWDGDADGASIEVVNGEVASSESEYVFDEGSTHYVYHRYTTRVQLQLDFHAFPFDEHDVGVELEHASEGASSILLAVDDEGTRHVSSPEVAGWIVDRPRYDVVTSRYTTSFGMPGVSPEEVGEYPRMRMRIRLHHDPATTFFKTFLTLFIAVFIAFLGFFMHADVLDARVGVGVAGMFGAVTSQSVVANNLPDIPYMTLSDKVHLAGITFIFLALVESCVIGFLVRHDRKALAERIDVASRAGMAPLFAVVVALLIALR